MSNDRMAHLHLHTDASIRDGMGTVRRLMTRAKGMGFRQIAMTDHGTLANAITFSIEAKAAGIKPLLGMEGYIAFDGVLGHITLLADGWRGWKSLLDLNNLAHQSEYRQPAFTIDELQSHSTGLICLTGCIASPFHQLSYDEAYRLGLRLKSSFGHRLFAEAMFVNDGESFKRSFRLAERLGLRTVITNDVHFPDREDAGIHPILTLMKSGFSYDSHELYLKSYRQLTEAAMRHGFSKEKAEEMLNLTGKVANKLAPISLKRDPHLPKVDFSRSLRDIVLGSEPRSHLIANPEYKERFEYEMGVIKEMGYEDYFLILNDILWEARREGVKIGPGRGSGAGSLVLYILGITDIDPISYGLQFERFLNPHRKGMPDVDVDIESELRELVLHYAQSKYGAVPIATYSRYSHKSLTRDLGKHFRIDKDVIDKAAEGGVSSDEFAMICDAEPKFLAAYESFMGQMRHKGKHAGGVIITDTPVPIERIGKEFGAAWTEGQQSELSYAGIVKFDLLGLSVLSALRKMEESAGDKPPDFPHDHSPEFGLFRNGELSGIFQFSGSEGIRDLTMKLQPDKFEDLIAINALYRPGAIDSGTTAKYPLWKKSPRDVPDYIADVLKPTYGAIVYQEQVMEVYRRTVGGSLADADIARRMIAKPKHDDPRWGREFAEMREGFLKAATGEDDFFEPLLSTREAKALWHELETHSRYSFNKAHATAYAMISWQCAWWKFHHPAVFFAAMLTTDPAQEQTYIIDSVQSGLTIVPPHVNVSGMEWRAVDDKIYMPLSAVKFLGDAGVEALMNARELMPENKFPTIESFMDKVPKRFVRARAREGLFLLGGFRGMWSHLTADEVIKTLALKDVPPTFDMRKRQQKYLGFIIPTKELLDEFESHRAAGFEVGIINNIDHRESKWGPYVVYRLSPSGVFWSRDVRDLEKGTIVAAKVSSKNGKAQRIKLL